MWTDAVRRAARWARSAAALAGLAGLTGLAGCDEAGGGDGARPPGVAALACSDAVLDSSFGGWRGVPGDTSPKLAAADSGELLVCAQYFVSAGRQVTRLLGDGSFDTSFGTSGSILLPSQVSCAGMAVVAGLRTMIGANVFGGPELGFIEPDGAVTLAAAPLPRPVAGSQAMVSGLRRAGDGTVVAVGVIDGAAAVWRVDGDGQPITSFGAGGVVVLSSGGTTMPEIVPATGPPSTIVVAQQDAVITIDAVTGAIVSTTPISLASVRGVAVTPTGTWVLGEDGSGLVVAPVGGGTATPLDLFPPAFLMTDAQGRLVVVGNATSKNFGVARLDPAGFDGVHPWSRLDQSFGQRGITYVQSQIALAACWLGPCSAQVQSALWTPQRLVVGTHSTGQGQYGSAEVGGLVMP